MDEYLVKVLHWLVETLEQEQKTQEKSQELKNRWGIGWLEYLNLTNDEKSGISAVNPETAYHSGLLFQVANNLVNLNKEFIEPLKEDPQFENIPENMLFHCLNEEQRKNYLKKYSTLITDLKKAIEQDKK